MIFILFQNQYGLPINNQWQPRLYLAPFSHSTSATDRRTARQTDGRTTTMTAAQPLLK